VRNESKDTVTAWFAALCFFLSTIEYLIPKPLPFLRLGLANLPVMLAIGILPFRQFCALILIKILGQGLIGGTLFSYVFAFSAVGTVSSALVMLALKKAFPRGASFVGISVAGAFASNASQLALARWFIFGESAWYVAPPFCAVGVVTGAILGLFANRYAARSEWYRNVREGRLEALRGFRPETGVGLSGAGPSGIATAGSAALAAVGGKGLWTNVAFRFAAGTALILALMFARSLALQAGIVAFGVILVLADRSRVRPIPALVMSASIILFNLLVPFGKVLATPFGFAVTEGALVAGIKKALAVEGMLFVSRWMLKGGFRLPGRAGVLVAEAFGIVGALTAERKRIDPRNLIASLDAVMSGRG
jgi:uncharacterized membrane protein